MAKCVMVLYPDPVDGYPPRYARDSIPTIHAIPTADPADPVEDRLHARRAARLRLG